MPMKTILVNESLKYEVEETGSGLRINNQGVAFDLQEITPDQFHILLGNASYSAELVNLDRNKKEALIKINGTSCTVSLTDEYDALLKSLGMEASHQSDAGHLLAPMPGLVLHLLVKPGDVLKKGEGLLVLEAMKMENLIKSHTDLRISSVEINQGDKVEKNQVLLRYESLS